MKTYKDTRIHQSGLMRCCLESVYAWVEGHRDEPAVPGTIIACAYGPLPNERRILGAAMVWGWFQREPLGG